jgi:hypothetical protein
VRDHLTTCIDEGYLDGPERESVASFRFLVSIFQFLLARKGADHVYDSNPH